MAPLFACPTLRGCSTPSSLEPQGLAAAREQKTADSGIWESFPCLGIFLLPTLSQPHGGMAGGRLWPIYRLDTVPYHRVRRLPVRILSQSLIQPEAST